MLVSTKHLTAQTFRISSWNCCSGDKGFKNMCKVYPLIQKNYHQSNFKQTSSHQTQTGPSHCFHPQIAWQQMKSQYSHWVTNWCNSSCKSLTLWCASKLHMRLSFGRSNTVRNGTQIRVLPGSTTLFPHCGDIMERTLQSRGLDIFWALEWSTTFARFAQS